MLRSKVKKHKNGRFKTVVCLVPAAICIEQINSILSDPAERFRSKGYSLLSWCFAVGPLRTLDSSDWIGLVSDSAYQWCGGGVAERVVRIV